MAINSGELSGCTIMYPIPPVDQSILRKVRFKLSHRIEEEEVKLLDSFCIYLKLQLAKGTKQVVVEFDDNTNAVDDEAVLCLIQIMGHNHCRMNINQ